MKIELADYIRQRNIYSVPIKCNQALTIEQWDLFMPDYMDAIIENFINEKFNMVELKFIDFSNSCSIKSYNDKNPDFLCETYHVQNINDNIINLFKSFN